MSVLSRWYPLIVPLGILAIGPEIAAIWTRFDPLLGHPTIPYVYTPLELWHWFGLMSTSTSGGPVERAVDVWLVLVALGFGYVIVQMFVDFLHGRNWGPMNYVLVALGMWSDLSRVMEGFPPSQTWWGPGGSAGTFVRNSSGRVAKRLAPIEKSAGARSQASVRARMSASAGISLGVIGWVWELRRFVVAMCLLAFGSYELYLSIAFHERRETTYADFVKTLPVSGWYRITNVPLDYGFALPHHDEKGVYGRYIPAIVPGAGGISLLVFANDATESTKGKIATTKDVDGIVETFAERSANVSADLKPYGAALRKTYRIIDEGDRPHPLFGLIFGSIGVVLGLLLTLAGIGRAAERRERAANDVVPSTA